MFLLNREFHGLHGIPLFPASARCSCGTVIDGFGDHVLGCSDGPQRIRLHDTICDVIWHALVQDNSGCKKEQHCGIALGMFFIRTFNLVSQSTLMCLCVILAALSGKNLQERGWITKTVNIATWRLRVAKTTRNNK